MNLSTIVLLLFVCSGSLLAQHDLTEASALDVGITKYLYLRYSETEDSLKSTFGARVRKDEALVTGRPILLNELWELSPSSIVPLAQLPPDALNTGLFLQYALVDKKSNFGVARIILVTNTLEVIPIIYKIVAKNNSIELVEKLTSPQGLFWLVQNLSTRGLSNLRRTSFLNKAGILDMIISCTDLTYGRTTNLDCLSEGISKMPEDTIESVFAILNENN